MRRLFIAFGIAVFLVYCWASVAYQNEVDMPGYAPVEIDLLGGKSRTAWDNNQQEQFQRLIELENKHYQLPAEGASHFCLALCLVLSVLFPDKVGIVCLYSEDHHAWKTFRL